MTGPTRADFVDAVRTPAAAFADPALAAADAVVGADGLPLPHPGDRAVVFHLCAADDDRSWGVKCYPAADPALADRYARVAAEVRRGRLPFAVPARFLSGGVRSGGRSYPAAVLDWVEGVPLNRAVRDRADDPAAVNALFRSWVRLAAGLRAAGAAHGELAHANVLVVPGADAVRLVDYDSFHFPGLPPAADAGHPNYRHPGGAEPADRDRFPLLVAATALRAVAVLGRGVWERFDTGDNLLFTAADFLAPAASPLLRELAGSGDATLRTLAAALARACGRPAAETPWVDDLCPDVARAADRPAAAAAEPRRPAVIEPRRPAGAAPPPKSAGRQLVIPLALVAGLFLIGAGTVAGLLSAVLMPPANTLAAGDDPGPKTDPAPKADPSPTPKARPAAKPPTPPKADPPKAPEVPPPTPGFRKVWVKPITDATNGTSVALTPDGRTVLAHVPNTGRVDVFDAKTGAVLPTLSGAGVSAVAPRVWSPAPDRVVLYGFPLPSPSVWNTWTGARRPALTPGPVAPGGPGNTGPTVCEVSPDGLFVFGGNQGRVAGNQYAPAPYALTDTATGRVIRAGEWSYGAARFTADGTRLLMAESNGRVRWLRIPGGETEVEWECPASLWGDRILGLSGDGGLALLRLQPGVTATYLMDGKAGQLLRRISVDFPRGPAGLTADGRWVVGLGHALDDRLTAAAVLSDARTGVVQVQTPLDRPLNNIPGPPAFAADGRAFVVFDRIRQEVAYYELRGDVPPVPRGTPVPPPVAAAPQRLAPGAARPPLAIFPPQGGLPPAPQFIRPVPPAVRPGLADVPALAARWAVAAPAGVQANGMPQPPLYAPDGKTIVLSGGADGTVLTFDTAAGAAGPVYDGHKGPGGTHWVLPFADKVVSGGFDGKQTTWVTRTGRKTDDLPFADLPPLPDGAAGHAGITRAVSPTGRFTVIARKEAVPGAGPLRVLNTTTGKVVLSGTWGAAQGYGNLAFTPDEDRLFVLDGLGKGTWYKLPFCVAEAEWAAGPRLQAESARVFGVSADGTRMLYNGPL
ncbi:MAG TPA: WD40 repeat domain-containing protein, partial [Urbifossiella sp.]|nr:WD40 repeat domain-containing protein [Urbifossiella sp.]